MFYQSPYILTICIASLYIPLLFKTKGNEMHVLACLSILMGCLIQIQSSLLSASNKETLVLIAVTSCFVCSSLLVYYRKLNQCFISLFYSYHNKTKCHVSHPICTGSNLKCIENVSGCNVIFLKWIGNDSRYRENVSGCYVNFAKWIGNDSRYRKNISRRYVNFAKWIGNDSRYRENISKYDVNFTKRIRKQVSKTRNRIASCRNIIYWLSFIISNFNNCLRVHSTRVYLFDPRVEKDAHIITDWYLEKHSFRIIISKSWLNFRDRSPPLDTYTEKIGLVKFD